MDYGEVFTKAGRLVWKHKILWLFGLLASCAAGNPGNFNYRFGSGDLTGLQGQAPQQMQAWLLGLQQWIRQTPGWFFVSILTLICGVSIVVWLVGIFGRAGLVRGAWQADAGEERLAFGTLSSETQQIYWKVLLASLLTGLPGFAIALIFALVAFFSVFSLFSDRFAGLGIGIICLMVPLICILVPLFWLLGVWGDLSTVAIAGEGQAVMEGLKRGWHMLTKHFGKVFLFALLLFFAQIAFGILLGLIFAPVGVGVLLGGFLTGATRTISGGLVLLGLLVLLPIALFVGALFTSYLGTTWTLIFRRLAAMEIQPPAVPAAPVSPYPQSTDFPPPSGPAV